MVLCNQPHCLNEAVATVETGDGIAEHLCERCTEEIYGLRRCAIPQCPNPATLTMTVAWTGYGVCKHDFCSKECAEEMLLTLGNPDVDGAIEQILADADI